MAGRVARIIADALTEKQRAALRAVSMNKVLNEWSADLEALKTYGLIKVERSGERFELTLTESGEAVAKAASG